MTLKDIRMNTFKDFILHIQGTTNSSKEKQETALYKEYMNQITNKNKTFFFMKYKKSIKTVLDKTSLHLCQSSTTYKELKNSSKKMKAQSLITQKDVQYRDNAYFQLGYFLQS